MAKVMFREPPPMTILARRPVRDFLTWASRPDFGTAPAVPTIPFTVGIARPARIGRERAPKGGIEVAGRFYKGGQLLPATASPTPTANPRDSWPAWTDQRWTIAASPASDIDLTAFAPPVSPPAPTKLAIYGFTYTAREIPAGECGSVAFELKKVETNNHYHVIRDHYGLVKCDCPDFLMRHDGTGQMCKHGSRLVELGMVPPPTPIPSTLGRREFLTPSVSVLRNATPDRVGC
jgi:hypothetical protein